MATILDDLFEELRKEGTIGEENSYSWGELFELKEIFYDEMKSEVVSCYDFPEAADKLIEIIDNTGGDVELFFPMNEYEDFYYDYDEDENTVSFSSMPDMLVDIFFNWVDENGIEIDTYSMYEYDKLRNQCYMAA